jgi:hypothetical protein
MTTFYRDMDRPETERPHFHVSLFQVGCLSDSDNGPFESLDDAIAFADDLVLQMNDDLMSDSSDDDTEIWEETRAAATGLFKRWERGTYVLAVEQCDYALKYCGEYPE